jgi:hypothetical protein
MNFSGGGGSVDWDDITNKPTAFPPEAHGHLDSEVQLTETYTGNLDGATTVKEAMDVLDAFVGGGVTKEQESLLEIYKFQNFGLNF